LEAVVEFTGHAVVATSLSAELIGAQNVDGFGGVVSPDFLRWLAGPAGWVGSHDAVLAGKGSGDGAIEPRFDLARHPRVAHAKRRRRDVVVYGDDHGLFTLGRGVAGRLELSVELFTDALRGRGHGRRLIEQALQMVSAGEYVFASVAPGNAASLRAFLACGFTPIGAEVILEPRR
jgi:GNAT superfamily N-acetyltransferase